MTSSAQFNALPLLSVKPALDEALDKIGAALEQYFAANGENPGALQEAIGELHRANAVLRMLSLDGALVFCGEMEKLLQEFAAGSLQPSSMHHEVLQRALLIFTHFLSSLAEGAPNVALRLFDPYQELLQARGIESAFAVDLFFPNLDVELPPGVAGLPQEPDGQAQVKAARSKYQQALLKWLRQDNPAEALQAMHAAVISAMACVPPRQRAFWWVASGLLDCMFYDGLPPELNAKKLLGRIDLRMKALADGAEVDERATLNEMLYLVASSHAVSETVEEIKQRYALDAYLPEEPPLPPGETAQVLEQMRAQLNGAEETWEKCALQDEAACAAFAGQADQLQALSERLDRNTLQLLCRQIQAAATHIGDADYRQRIRLDMAMALILLGSGVTHYAYLGEGFHEQVRILGQRLQHVPAEMPEVRQLVPLHCAMAQREIIPPLSEAMANNLQHVEQELNAFFANQDKRQELALLVRMLNHVQGALHILSLDAAEKLLAKVKDAVNRYAEGANVTPDEMRATATAVSALGGYIHDLGYGQKPDTAVLEKMLLEAAPRPAPPPAAAPEPKGGEIAAVAMQPATPEDSEMLEVFLEEAQDVLGILRTNLGLSQLHPESMEPLVTMRRGFHTLKGSGRMVGLNDLGEVAWAVERAMNKWLQENKPATPGLLQFLADAEALFHAWVDSLRTHSGKMINTSPLVEAAQHVERGEDLPVTGVPTLAPELPTAVPFESLGLAEVAAAQPVAAGELPPAEPAPPAAGAEAIELPFSLEGILPPSLEVAHEAAPAEAAAEFALPDLYELLGQPQPAPAPAPELPFALEELLPASLDVAREEAPAAPEAAPGAPTRETAPLREAPAAVSRQPVPAEAAESDTVTIGKVTMSAALFDIASEECASNLSKLQNYFAELRSTTPPVVAYDFMRAAHTLAGVNRTMGFTEVADLSRALEMWLEARIGKVFALTPAQIALVEEAIATLDAMFLDICNHQGPEAQPELIGRLQADQDAFIMGEAPAAPGMHAPEAHAERAGQFMPEKPAPMEKIIWGAATVPPAAPSPVPGSPVPPLAAAQPVSPPPEPAHAALEGGAAAAEAGERVRQYVEERSIKDEIDDQLLPIFLEESIDLQAQVGRTLRAWRADPDDVRVANELQRGLHTLKGSARMAGVMRLGELTHRMEDRVIAGMNKALRTEVLWDELDAYFDRLTNALERLRAGSRELEEYPGAAAAAAAAPTEAAAAPEAQAAPARAETAAERAVAMLRVRSETVDRLVNDAGEISVARSRLEAELRAFRSGLSDMNESVARLRKQLREIEIQAESQMEARVALARDMAEKFDPLEFDRFTRFQELTRFMGESVHDVQTVQQTLLKNLDEAAAAMSAQAYLNRELQQSLMAIRMVPFTGISDRLYRIVRQTAKELQKRVNLDLKGVEVEMDRSVLDRMTAPFEHILRNAVAHGLETPEERNRRGKSPIGQIQVALAQESNEVVFDIVDDGAGIDLDALRSKAVERGLVPAGVAMSDEDAVQLIFHSGLSTAAEVTEISGRGVGMDVVRNEIAALGGQVSVRTERGKGTRFTIRLPLTLAVTQVLMTRSGHDQYAIPSVMVEQVLHLKPAALEDAHRAGVLDWQGKSYPLKYLPHLLGDEAHVPESRLHNSVLLLHSAEQRVALLVDELLGNQEAVVKNIGPQLSRLPGIAGATVQGNGSVVLILNPVALTQPAIVGRREVAPVAPQAPLPEEAPPIHALPLVMVVDDSLTVRKVTSRMLARAGYDVATAKDGVDALEQLTQIVPDVMLLDVEMPRMDGFELTRQIRRDPKLHNLPILMITSRTAEKHRDYALELGVNAYFGKPFQEEELLQQISAYVHRSGR
jgi:chemosensory pili system protein ChpA (sensor histidine kinase/response regulator)